MRSENKPIFRCCTTYVAQLADTLKARSAVKGLFIHLHGGDDDPDACGRARLQSLSCSRSPSPPFPRNSAHHPPPEPLPQSQQISWPPRDFNATADGCSHTLQSWGSCQTSAFHGSGSTCRWLLWSREIRDALPGRSAAATIMQMRGAAIALPGLHLDVGTISFQ